MCCCNYGCCCCHYPNKPSARVNSVVMILFLASAGTIIGLGIAGFVYSIKLNSKYRKIKCSMLLFINELIEGASEEYSPEANWRDSKQIEKDISTSLNTIKAVAKGGYTFFGKADYSYANNALTYIKERFSATNNKVTHPWLGGKNLELDILYDNPTGDELFAYLDAEIKTYKHIYTLMPYLVDAAESLEPGRLCNIDDTLDGMNDFDGQVKDWRHGIHDMLDSGDTSIKIAQFVMTIYYVVIIGCCSITVLGPIFLAFRKSDEWRRMSNLGCLILTLLMIVGFLLTAVLMPISVMFIEICEVTELENLKKDPGIIDQKAWNQLRICLDEDYRTPSKFILDKKIDALRNAQEGTKEISEIYDNKAGNRECKVKYNHAEKMITKLKEIRDKNPEAAAPNSFPNSLSSLNKQSLDDEIVWFEEECKTENIIGKTNSIPDRGACFPIASLGNDCKTHVGRYSTNSSCTEFSTTLHHLCDYYNGLERIITDLIKEIERKPDYVPSQDGTIDNHFKSAMDRNNHELKICQLTEDLGTSEEGLSRFGKILGDLCDYLEDLGCGLFKYSYNRVHTAACESFVQNFTSIVLSLGIISISIFIFLVFLICVNRRFYVQKDIE